MITIPSTTKQWVQTNESDLTGNLAQTKNITFDDKGYLQLSNSSRAIMDESIDTDFNRPAVILFSSDYGYFVETTENAFQVSTEILTTRPTEIVTSGVPVGDVQSDAVWFGGLMPVTQNTDIKYYDPVANTWTDTNVSLTNSGQHQLVNFLGITSLAVANVNTVNLYATPISATPILITTLQIGLDFNITSMVYFNQNLYIGTHHLYGGHAFMYVWNGLGSAAQQAYEVDSNTIFSMCVYKDSIVCFTGNGSLLQFNGGGFNFLAGFPIYYTDQALVDETNIGMDKNIMKANGELLYILFTNRENNAARLLTQPDGLWCYDPKVGLYHRYSLSMALVQIENPQTSAVNTTTNQITVTNSYMTGTEVYYNDGASTTIPELVSNTKYFVIRVDATHIQLATTRTLALAGTAIDLTGTGSNFQKLYFFPNTDYGQFFTGRTSALNVIERPVSNRQYGTELLWGADVNSRADSASADGRLGTVSDGVEARGYFITPKIFSENVTDKFNLLTLKFSPFSSDIDKIILKYRTYDDMQQFIDISSTPGKGSITWTSTTTFTTVDTNWANAVVGNEVEVLRGGGAGLLAHITVISLNAGTYTVTLDDSYVDYVTGDLARAVFRNWIKIATISYASTDALNYYYSAQLGVTGKFIQVKVELRGSGIKIEELKIDNIYQLPAHI